jgi:hypothetical protein
MRGKLERIVFSDATAAIFVKKKIKGTRSTKRHNTKGRNGKDKISLWRELCVIMVRNQVAVDTDLDRIRAALDKNELPLFADVRSICPPPDREPKRAPKKAAQRRLPQSDLPQ